MSDTAELRGGTEPQVRRVCRGHGVPAFGSALVRQQKAEPPIAQRGIEAREADLKSRGVDQSAGIGLRTASTPFRRDNPPAARRPRPRSASARAIVEARAGGHFALRRRERRKRLRASGGLLFSVETDQSLR